MYLEDSSSVPFDTLTTLVGLINYGGRITDYNDEKVVVSLLLKFFNPKVLEDGHTFATNDAFTYSLPATDSLADVTGFIETLPLVDKPDIFGLNANATVNLDIKNSLAFLGYLQQFEPSGRSNASEGSGEDAIVRLVDRMAERLGDPIKIDTQNSIQSMVIFRNQEALRLNDLLRKIRTSLSDLKDAIKGLVVMSLELEGMFDRLMTGKVPENWEKLSYLSLKPVASWFEDLLLRVDFFKAWMAHGSMKSYWISSFFFPQGFMTAVLQTYSRNQGIAIDTLSLAAQTTKESFKTDEAVKVVPEQGVNIHGLFLENAHYDTKRGSIVEALPKTLLEPMSIIWLEPTTNAGARVSNVFDCPVYKTSERRGELSTTGHSTNFITYFGLKFESENRDFWVRRGVAVLLQTND
jgi:dynein heavy chain